MEAEGKMTAPPEPRMKGRFNLYDTPDGGLHISYQEDPKVIDEDWDQYEEQPIQHIDVPAQVLVMAKMLENGSMNPLQALGKMKTLFGGKK
jgi:hypothetical protein